VRLMKSIADKEEGEAESSQGIPAHEMLGDMLLDSKHPEAALVEYETTLKTNPGRFDALYGAAQVAEQVGKHDQANDYFAKLVKNCQGATSERSELKHAREITEARAAKN
jgi:tetratricopeptide (TPR) repeat protein